MSGDRLCARCDRTITGAAEVITVDGGSGARPDQHAHPYGDPACRPTTRGRWEQRLAAAVARALATVDPPDEAVRDLQREEDAHQARRRARVSP
ncbi:hypothetical protein ABT084_34010 [Streptomyces sp. NPDC002138]|uniref:hypothetical protein n=1 Tax=Streptomyces sp. NPDC002138 TaxID=3154410 RepID=UPI003334306F